MFKAFLRGTDIQNPQLEVHGSFPPCKVILSKPCKVILSKTHLTLATWETGPATPWCLEPAYERVWMFKFRKWKLAMQGLTIRYMLQNVCQIRCKYESHAILFYGCGIFGRQGLACMTDIDQETFLGAFIILSFYFIFIFPLLRWTRCFSLSIICIYETKIKSEILKLLSFFCCHWKIHAEPWSDEFQKIRSQSPKITSRQRGRRVCVFSCIQFLKMGLASIFWRLGIQQSWRSEGRELVAKPADVCLCHNLVHLLTRLGFKSSVRCWWTWNSLHLQLKHNSTVSEARFVLLKIDFGPALLLLS